MKNIIIQLTIVFFLIGILSCNKTLLDQKPLDSFSDAAVWNDLKLTEAYVNNLYLILPGYTWQNTRGLILSSACDEGYCKFNYNNIDRINTGILTPDNTGGFDTWASTYAIIKSCNTFFSHINEVPGDIAFRNRLEGEVTYLRAYGYFELTRNYGGVPLITKEFGLKDNYEVARNTYAECVDFMVAELDRAAALLPDDYNGDDKDLGRVTKGAALALKSRVLLYAASPLWNPTNDLSKWQKAADASKAVIDMPQYQLYNGVYSEIFTKSFNSEIIFSRSSNGLYGFHAVESYLSPSSFHGWAAYAASQNMADAFGMANGKAIDDVGSGYDPQHPYINRDPRFYEDLVYDGRPYRKISDYPERGSSLNIAEFYEGGRDSPEGDENWNASLTRYTFRKYCDTTYNFNLDPYQASQHWIISRLSEMFLNYAEAEFYLGNEPEARKNINIIRERASVPLLDASVTGTSLENKIRNERQVELCLEGHRFYDVRRWKIAEVTENKPLMQVVITKKPDNTKTYSYQVLQQRKFIAPQHYLLPIPKAELDRVHLEQNPGYN